MLLPIGATALMIGKYTLSFKRDQNVRISLLLIGADLPLKQTSLPFKGRGGVGMG